MGRTVPTLLTLFGCEWRHKGHSKPCCSRSHWASRLDLWSMKFAWCRASNVPRVYSPSSCQLFVVWKSIGTKAKTRLQPKDLFTTTRSSTTILTLVSRGITCIFSPGNESFCERFHRKAWSRSENHEGSLGHLTRQDETIILKSRMAA